MKPETARFLEKAQDLLAQADTMLGVGLNEAAGRTAYLAGFNAAKALLFEHHDHSYTSHGGVQRHFARLTKDEPRLDPRLRAFLSNSYNLKSIADYETGPGSQVSAERAKDATETAHQFVACIAGLIPPSGPTRPASDAPKH